MCGRMQGGALTATKAPEKKAIEVPPPTIGADFAALLGNDDTSDVTFRLIPDSGLPSPGDSAMLEPESTVRAHRLVLQARSPVFRSMLAAGMMEGETGMVTVSDMQPDVFRALMHFVYSDDLPDELQVRS